MNTYIDLGAYNGDSVEEFKNWGKIAFGEREWTIYAFEPNPKFKAQLQKRGDCIFSDKAAWVEDTKLTFAVDPTETPMGSTVMPGKLEIWRISPKIEVEAFDFSEWLWRLESDFIVVKMDIEGAEFPVLEKMLKDGTITIPDKLMVEFHPNKVNEYTTTDKLDLMKRIKDRGVDLVEWH